MTLRPVDTPRRHRPGAGRPRRLGVAAAGVLAALATWSASGAVFLTTTSSGASLALGTLTGVHAPAAGTATFTAVPQSSDCVLSWGALSGSTAVADRYEVIDVGAGTTATTTAVGSVGSGTATITGGNGRTYRLGTRSGANWVSATADDLTATCTTTTYSFTTAGATGRNGPSQAQLDATYAGTTLAGAVTSSAGIQTWTVPATGSYQFTVNGAAGGGPSNNGFGAQVTGTLALTSGTVLKILVGQMGIVGTADAVTSGGGGASFVATSTGTLYFVGGGGGGAGSAGVIAGGTPDARTGTTVIGSAAAKFASTGASYSTNGVPYTFGTNTAPLSFTNGGTGGAGGTFSGYLGGGHGGFGGGGNTCACSTGGGGGGGGYNGGGAAATATIFYSGYGGSSFVTGSATSTSAAVLGTKAAGSVTVVFLG